MAATEVIHFPLGVQLDRGTTFLADAFRDGSVNLIWPLLIVSFGPTFW
jgi:hypothetical protein